jgi:hypothetical protein
MASKGHDTKKQPKKSKPVKEHEGLKSGSETPQQSPGGYRGPPERNKD